MTTPHPLEQLDAQALRDLGLDRSELSSLAAEAEGSAPRSRRRLDVVGATSRPRRNAAGRRGRVSARWTRLLATVVAIAAVAAVSAAVRHTPRDAFAVAATSHGPAAADLPPRAAVDAAYFPDQVPPPDGEIEPLPNQF